ncbi:uncharacterized protein LOC132933804 [Metopolophium dirhodum]|uniref:uncharacterized protein LOC132933804 n=1 Tax=Metopolophium dirhodum TaxID=44670 RepID=UPI00298FE428|nr:uncharacterized protein LOC132933804 [Metopolophium dirhodum]
MTAKTESAPAAKNERDGPSENFSFSPMLYNFRVAPPPGHNKTFSLQQPLATLFDNLITVLWSVYGKKSKIKIGINQLQWALEFLRCMKVNYGYPESIEKIVGELEEQLISLYAKVGEKMQENKRKKDLEEMEKDVNEKNSKSSGIDKPEKDTFTSYNEEDIMGKLDVIKLTLDPVSGEVKYLKELNSLGKRKQKPHDPCANDKKQTKNYMIGALQKILSKTTEPDTKNGVEELIKGLKVDNPASKKT